MTARMCPGVYLDRSDEHGYNRRLSAHLRQSSIRKA